MPEPNGVLDVLTLKRGDNRPILAMTLDEINEASEQPTEDATWDRYSVGEFDDANRYELHMDWHNPDTDEFERVVDGREAEWDTQNEEISIQLQRSDVALEGEYYFEWVIVYDEPDADTGEVPTSATADEVNTVPSKGFFNLSVEEPTSREIGEREPVDRTVGTLTVETYIRGPDGPLPLAGSQPTEDNHAAHKQYVDSAVGEKADSTHDHSGGTIGTEDEPAEAVYSSEGSIDLLNNVHYVNAQDGASAVQSAVESNSIVYVFSPSDTVEWTDDVGVPDNTRLEAWTDFTIQIPDGGEPDTITVEGGEWRSVIHNADMANGNENVEIVGFTVDYQGNPADGSTKTQVQNAAPIWIHRCTNSLIEDCESYNALPDSGGTDVSERPYNIQMSMCEDSRMVDCYGDNAGYECIAIRGTNNGCEVIRTKGGWGGSHSMQISEFTGEGVDNFGAPEDITLVECKGDGRFTLHGTAEYPAKNIRMVRCHFPDEINGIRIIDTVQDVTLRDNYGGPVLVSAVKNYAKGITIDGHRNPVGDTIKVQNLPGFTAEIDNIHLQNIHKNESGNILRIDDQGDDSTTFGNFYLENCSHILSGETVAFALITTQIESISVRDSYAAGNEGVRAQSDDGHIDEVHIHNCDLSDLSYAVRGTGGGTYDTAIIDGKGEGALGGGSPDATNWPEGTTVEDTDNPGTLWYIYDSSSSSGATQIGT